MKIRRLVTGHTTEGNSTFVGDAELDAEVLATRPGWAVAKLWAADAPARFPDTGSEPKWSTQFPPLGGYRFFIMAELLQPSKEIVVPPLSNDTERLSMPHASWRG